MRLALVRSVIYAAFRVIYVGNDYDFHLVVCIREFHIKMEHKDEFFKSRVVEQLKL